MTDSQIRKQALKTYFSPAALLPSGWATNVLFTINNGVFTDVQADQQPHQDSIILSGPTLPSLANVHSHAFQRVMAGAAEVSLNPNDSFWSWRDLMYKIVQKLTPNEARIIATQLYIDMLKAGYTQVGEFHYLHHAVGGKHYNDLSEMSNQIIAAANDSGIGLTLFPVLYSHSGFGGQAPNAGQARFINSTDSYLQLHQACHEQLANHETNKLGICFHSLRAVTKPQIETVLTSLSDTMPIHIHISEQQKEVQDCLDWSGKRPVQWLQDEIGLNERWCLVHATHLDEKELQAIATSGAIAGLCPTTEANLGDGIFPGVEFEQANGRWGIGSDSHVSLSIVEELRTLEYGQRLRDQKRNRIYRPEQNRIGDNLYQQALLGGNQACDVKLGLAEGHRADFLVLDSSHPFMAASLDANKTQDILNRWLFATNENLIKDVFVAGKQQIKNFHHVQEDSSRLAFTQVIKKVMYDA
ncbi:N-formimino-L-glutamate deiminase [Marinomonas ushuaiensis DSM 15871]|uniref:N-formimino-L-glutamate deiminase n=1 Tax=Marinomonas ushuaiensis DSM 15871 TaxID=1122207 RepID=X7E9M1_9GAMM|nr:N-formimino-L-glutamate deiminase [Marinomonas ushuaiensis DSM 15871]